jgi:hypothetical protein
VQQKATLYVTAPNERTAKALLVRELSRGVCPGLKFHKVLNTKVYNIEKQDPPEKAFVVRFETAEGLGDYQYQVPASDESTAVTLALNKLNSEENVPRIRGIDVKEIRT